MPRSTNEDQSEIKEKRKKKKRLRLGRAYSRHWIFIYCNQAPWSRVALRKPRRLDSRASVRSVAPECRVRVLGTATHTEKSKIELGIGRRNRVSRIAQAILTGFFHEFSSPWIFSIDFGHTPRPSNGKKTCCQLRSQTSASMWKSFSGMNERHRKTPRPSSRFRANRYIPREHRKWNLSIKPYSLHHPSRQCLDISYRSTKKIKLYVKYIYQ